VRLPLLARLPLARLGISVEELRSQGSEVAVRRRVMLASLAFVLGFSVIFVLLGASATLLGRVMRSFRLEVFGVDIGIAQIAGVLIILMGLHLTGLIQIPLLYREKRFEGPTRPTSLFGAGLVGAAFAFAWTPCVRPILGRILARRCARYRARGDGAAHGLLSQTRSAVPMTAWASRRSRRAAPLPESLPHHRTRLGRAADRRGCAGVHRSTHADESVFLLPRGDRGEARRGAALKAWRFAIAAAVLLACGETDVARRVRPAPAFALTDLQGKTVSLADFAGRTVVIDFWRPGAPRATADPRAQRLPRSPPVATSRCSASR
jgi:hypothetical protein